MRWVQGYCSTSYTAQNSPPTEDFWPSTSVVPTLRNSGLGYQQWDSFVCQALNKRWRQSELWDVVITLMYDTKQAELCPAQPDTPLVLKVESDIFL